MAELVARWQQGADRRAIFLDCYLRMTQNMLIALDAGEFHDTPWVDRLLERFAGYYFDALRAYEQDRARTPAVWRVAHDAASRLDTMTLQHLMLGVNAHINYDLVLVTVELLRDEWPSLDATARRHRYDDYTYVNQIIARTIDIVQDEIIERASPAFAVVDVLLGRVDEWATEQLITAWREEVWRHAVAMVEATDACTYETRLQSVETATLERAAWIAGFGVQPS
jgi:hypothetical protein